ncbi:hypothetical protein [Aureitalea marina]|uniref:hypothetical protein n=1 Tax=Aureitalea marina TaxID=930804 RepID=UPI000CF1FFF9|nr:hypothetical protein [Aureitalea marina]
MGFVDVLDVVDVMILLTKSSKEAERYILVGHNLTYKQLIENFASKLGAKVPKRRAGKGLLNFFRSLDYLSALILGRKQTLFKDSVRSLCRRAYYSSEKIKDDMGFKFRPLSETVQRLASDYSKES